MEERTFTWFPKLTHVVQALPAENVAEFAVAVAEYGTCGEEPAFSSPLLAAVFEGVREDIDNSVNARHSNKGGRPRKNARENGGFGVSETKETPVSQNGNQFQECETPVTGFENQGEEVSENGNPPYINQTIPNQAKPNQERECARARAERREPFDPPTPEEVGEYAESQGIAVDAQRFVDFYASNGWMVGKVPMADWRAAARRWGERAAPSGPRAKPRRCPKCGAQISKSAQTGKWECGACGETYGRLP